ncbi:MAG: DUF1569 domain-containing protein [Acidobacteria bacterium]|nr:DUF1569 domain-containing protein [Acidobacteriota bacterium]
MGKTVFNEADREALLIRVASIQTGTKPRWGQMNAVKMLRHITGQFEVALGELICAPLPGPMANPFFRWFAIDSPIPWPKGVRTAPELISQPTAGVEEEQTRFRSKLAKVAERGPNGDFSAHPAFGKLSTAQWGRLMYRHVDHHLRQFGV